MIPNIEYSIGELKEIVINTLYSKNIPMIWGATGQSKSSLGRMIAEELNLEYVDIRLAERLNIDILGFPKVNDHGRSEYHPFVEFPLENDPIPEGKQGWLIAFDELSAADPDTQKSSYRVMLDHQVGSHNLHPRALKMAMGNRGEDGAFVEEMSSALQSRMAHFVMKMNSKDWLSWAYQNSIHPAVIAFISQNPQMLNTYDDQGDDFTFASPRTLHMLSNYLKTVKKRKPNYNIDLSKIREVVGFIGSKAGTAFCNYASLGIDLPKIEDILNKPGTTEIPNEIQKQYILTALISVHMTKENADKAIQYMDRLNRPELVITSIRGAVQRDPSLIESKDVLEWSTKKGIALLGD